MNSVQPNIVNDIKSAGEERNYGFPISKERELATWLQAVEYHAKAGSPESLNTLLKHAEKIPDWSFLPFEMQEDMEKIREIAAKNQWDPSLSPLSKKTLLNVCKQYFPEEMIVEKPQHKAVRRLDFSDAAISGSGNLDFWNEKK